MQPPCVPNQHGFAPFAFRKRTERVDWRKIAALDVDQIARDLDFEALQDNIANIAFCNIECEIDTRCCDPNYIKLFRLAQFIIDYLLHSQDYLSHMVVTLEAKCQDFSDELQRQRLCSQSLEQELKIAKEEARKFRKQLCAQREAPNHHLCPFCSKMFLSNEYLQCHIRRRHTNVAPPPVAVPQCTDKLVDEINALKNSLEQREKQLQQEQEHRSEMLQKGMEQWKQLQKQEHQMQLEEVRAGFICQLQDVCKRATAAEQCVDTLQKQMNCMPTQIPQVQVQPTTKDIDVLNEQKRQFCKLKKYLTEMVENAICQQLKEQEDQLQKRIKCIFKEQNQELGKLNTLVQEKICQPEPVPMNDDFFDAICERTRVQDKLLRQQQRRLRRIRCEQVKQQQQLELQQKKACPDPSPPQPQPPTNVETKPVAKSSEKKKPSRRCRKYLCHPSRPRRYLHCRPYKPQYILSLTGSDSYFDKDRLQEGKLSSSDVTDALDKQASLVKGLRHELSSLLSQKLQSHGLHPSTTTISNTTLARKLTELELERKLFQQEYPLFDHLRSVCEHQLDKVVSKSNLMPSKGKILRARPHLSDTETIYEDDDDEDDDGPRNMIRHFSTGHLSTVPGSSLAPVLSKSLNSGLENRRNSFQNVIAQKKKPSPEKYRNQLTMSSMGAKEIAGTSQLSDQLSATVLPVEGSTLLSSTPEDNSAPKKSNGVFVPQPAFPTNVSIITPEKSDYEYSTSDDDLSTESDSESSSGDGDAPQAKSTWMNVQEVVVNKDTLKPSLVLPETAEITASRPHHPTSPTNTSQSKNLKPPVIEDQLISISSVSEEQRFNPFKPTRKST